MQLETNLELYSEDGFYLGEPEARVTLEAGMHIAEIQMEDERGQFKIVPKHSPIYDIAYQAAINNTDLETIWEQSASDYAELKALSIIDRERID